MKILIVDDEQSVVEVLIATVESVFPWHSVRGVESVNEAIIAAYEEGGVDLLIADIDLGESDGFQVRAELAQIFPEMQTVFVSGADSRNFASVAEGFEILRKPLVPKEVIKVVENAEMWAGLDRSEAVAGVARPLAQHAAAHERKVHVTSAVLPTMPPRPRPHAVPMPAPKVASVGHVGGRDSVGQSVFFSRGLLPMASILVGLGVVAILFFQKASTGSPQSPPFPVPIAVAQETDSASTVSPDGGMEVSTGKTEPSVVPHDEIAVPILIGDDFEGGDRALTAEPQWRVHPVGHGAHEIVVGEGTLRARSSELVVATFEAALVTEDYDWLAILGNTWIGEGEAGLVFGFRDVDNFYRISRIRPDNRLAVIHRVNGEDEMLWEVEDGLTKESISAEFHAVDQTVTVECGEGGPAGFVEIARFEGGKFGVFVARTPGAGIGGFELSLHPGTSFENPSRLGSN